MNATDSIQPSSAAYPPADTPRLLSAHRIQGKDRIDEVQLLAAPDGHFSLVVNCYKEYNGEVLQDYNESWCYTTMGQRGMEKTMSALERHMRIKLFCG